MDGSQFDAWTRRGFGAAAGGLAGSLLTLSALPGAEAAKKKGKGKKKKKRCGKLNDVCNSGKKKCCCGYECQQALNNNGGNHCCRAAGFPASSAQDCCNNKLELGHCVCKTLGQPCSTSQPEQCCSGSCNTSGMSTVCGTPP